MHLPGVLVKVHIVVTSCRPGRSESKQKNEKIVGIRL